jgi:hypothetical protein
MRDRRDQRDPQKLGEMLRAGEFRTKGQPLSQYMDGHARAIFAHEVPDYDGSGPMSNDPAEHHSKTPQTVDLQEPSDGPLGDS